MHANGESAAGAARRLGMSRAAFEKWARRHVPHLWHSLRLRDPIPIDPLSAQRVAEQRLELVIRRAS